MTSQSGQETITIHILHNILRSKENQAMKFSQLIEYNNRNIFLQKSYGKRPKKLAPDLFFLKNALYGVKANSCSLVSVYFDSPQLDIQ